MKKLISRCGKRAASLIRFLLISRCAPAIGRLFRGLGRRRLLAEVKRDFYRAVDIYFPLAESSHITFLGAPEVLTYYLRRHRRPA